MSRKDGTPKTTPDLTKRMHTNMAGIHETDNPAPKVWITNYELRINGTTLKRTVTIPRGAKRADFRDAVGSAMAKDLADLLQQMFGD